MESPISSLPPEILGDIFLYIVADDRNSLACVPASHVCALWRAITVDSPRLWARIPTNNSYWAAEMLLRSESIPLSVQMEGYPTTHFPQRLRVVSRTLHAVLRSIHAARIEELRLHSIGEQFARDIIHHLASVITVPLKILHLDCSWPFMKLEERLDTSPTYYNPKIAPHLASHLRTLRLISCPVSWDLPPFPCLERLRISPPSTDYNKPTLMDLCTMLVTMPHLRHLDLTVSVRDPKGLDAPNDPVPVHLPFLRTLHLGPNWKTLRQILQYVTFPSSTDLSVKLKGTAVDVEALLASVETRLGSLAGKLLINVGFPSGAFPSLRINLHTTETNLGPSETGHLDLIVSVLHTPSGLVEALLSYMDLEQITDVHLGLTGRTDQFQPAVRALLRVPTVTNLTIAYISWNFDEFIGAPEDVEVPWAHLELVVIDGAPTASWLADHPPWERCVNGLERWLRWRRDRGVRVPKVCVRKPMSGLPSPAERSSLESITEVEWELGEGVDESRIELERW
ncbi:hypothetical protein PLICRDRAFT_45921 [Plicaturopsis crispa FD-325 SS-3]|uniref:F-box domain-containing protein n=1 Tax=Plicaturopsis crispa FD-325 SS-3 TaxID=944288 RepID=A0A0C9SKY4_PLICR|nr:hypothetical protein PLICRDRAFT_45921 [Plicaturopsis crispa FD-325 SS-3]